MMEVTQIYHYASSHPSSVIKDRVFNLNVCLVLLAEKPDHGIGNHDLRIARHWFANTSNKDNIISRYRGDGHISKGDHIDCPTTPGVHAIEHRIS